MVGNMLFYVSTRAFRGGSTRHTVTAGNGLSKNYSGTDFSQDGAAADFARTLGMDGEMIFATTSEGNLVAVLMPKPSPQESDTSAEGVETDSEDAPKPARKRS